MSRYVGIVLVIGAASGCGHSTATPVKEPVHAQAPPVAPPPPPPLFDDLGDWHRDISSTSQEARRYFDQGLRLVYAFNHDEAERAFREAARLDPECAICWWGVALVLGPNINLPAMPERAKKAYEAAQMAAKIAAAPQSRTPEVERGLCAAIARRYAPESPAKPEDQAKLDTAYADAMRELAKTFPDDLDVQTLAAESMMDLRPWDFWTPDGKPQPGTEEIVARLEGVIAKNPQHPGANHYLIHAIEASPHPDRALDAAGRVGGMMKGAGHLVHMPAHVYIRTGKYEEASEANRRAIEADKSYLGKAKPPGYYSMYVAHNYQFLWATSMMEGRSAESIQAMRDLSKQFPLSMIREMLAIGMDVALLPAYWVLVKFGRWDEVMTEPAPPADLKTATALWHFARAFALAATGKLDAAEQERAAIVEVAKATPDGAMTGFQPSKQIVGLAATLAGGEIAARSGKTDEAVKLLGEAVKVEDGLHYAEPPDWYFPVRHVLGAVLLDAGRAPEAEKVYREDLVHNPGNGWALFGLGRALRAQKKKAVEAGKVEAEFKKAWEHADVTLELPKYRVAR